MPGTNDKKQQFITLLHELFQLDQPELDFGFYKIMHAKSGQITRFIDEELSEHIDAVFAGRGNQSAAEQAEQARQAVLKGLGEQAFDEQGDIKPEYQALPLAQDYLTALKAQREGGALSDDAQVYDHLYRFFSRYYDQGDFLSTRYRQAPSDTRDAPYSVPYDGREVYLHWANKDQYYIKSSETLRNYGFDLNAAVRQLAGGRDAGGQGGFGFGADHTPRRVHFQIVDAPEGVHGNVKDSEQRFFIIHDAEPILLRDNQLTIQFQYRPDPHKTGQNNKWQQTRLAEAEATVLKALDAEGDTGAIYKQALATPAPTAANENRTLLAKHLYQYTARHSMDYFIHKNLGGFLRRELDFYIKNEVMRLDHIESAQAPAVADYLEKVKVIRRIARRIIEFLAQLEDFQKKLWLKKKFVTETNYCITLDRIPEEFYPEIAANEQQIQNWEDIFSISSLPGYTRPLHVDFLKRNRFLTIDTKLFPESAKHHLIASINELDHECRGTILHSENFQALNLINRSYCKRVRCLYIDPPYNTDATPIVYKNGYKTSTWATLLHDRLTAASVLRQDRSVTISAIDDTELVTLSQVLNISYPTDQQCRAIVEHYPGSGTGRSNLTRTHEYCLFSVSSGDDILRGDIGGNGERERNFRRSGQGENNYRSGRPNSFYAILVEPDSLDIVGAEPPPKDENYYMTPTEDGLARIYPIGEDGSERVWTLSYEAVSSAIAEGRLRCTNRMVINRKYFDNERRNLLPSVWAGSRFSAVSHGTNLLRDLFGNAESFSYPKSLKTLEFCIQAATFNARDSITCDYFAGSGTTAHAIINLNRQDGGTRGYVLAEMGDYLETVLKSRIQKVVFSNEWKKGKPKPDAEGDYHGVSHCFKYLRLESYEDALNNLVLHEDADRERALEENDELRHDYMLRYWLDTETQGSASLLNVAQFKDPTNYRMKIKRPGGDESVEQPIDLVETFNWLIGLHVELLDKPRTFAAEFEREADPDLPEGAPTRLKVKGRLKEREDGGHWFRTVEGWVARTPGATQDVDKVLVIWRKLTEDAEQDTAALESLLANQLRINQRDTEFDAIYINGPHGLSTDFEGKHRLHSLEEAFNAAMWAED